MRQVAAAMTLFAVLAAGCDQNSQAPRAAPSVSSSPTDQQPPDPEPITEEALPDSGVFAIVETEPCVRRRGRYRAIPVEIHEGDPAVLNAAVHGVLLHWFRERPRVAERAPSDISVSVEGDRAVIDVRDSKHFAWASTSCGSSIFVGDLVHTALQFPTVSDVEFRYKGSCIRWGKYVQAGPLCFVYSLDDEGQVVSERRKDV